MTKETTASQPKVAAPDENYMDAMRELVSDFRKAAYEFGKRHDPADQALMMRLQQQLFVELRAVQPIQPKSIGDDAVIERAIRFIGTGSHTMIAREIMMAELRRFLADFRAPAAQASATIQAAPEGYAIVPIKPTQEMENAYFKVIDKNMQRVTTDARFGRYDNFRAAYTAMIASIPAATIQEPVMVAEPMGAAAACPDCHGQGTWIGGHDGYDDADCHSCDGSGKRAATVKAVPSEEIDLMKEARELAPILRGMCEGGGADRGDDIYAADYQAADGDVFVIRAAELLADFAAPLADKTGGGE